METQGFRQIIFFADNCYSTCLSVVLAIDYSRFFITDLVISRFSDFCKFFPTQLIGVVLREGVNSTIFESTAWQVLSQLSAKNMICRNP